VLSSARQRNRLHPVSCPSSAAFSFANIYVVFCGGPLLPFLPFALPDYPAMNVFINDIPLIIKKTSDKLYKHR
jgi:hypothetical protein